MKVLIINIFLNFLFIHFAYGVTNIHVLLDVSNEKPYSINARSNTLTTFQATVLGQLLRYDNNLMLEPSILEHAYYDFKTNNYILKLKEKTFFHNGREANSIDLEFSLLKGFYTKYSSYDKMFLGNINGVEEIEKLKLTKFKSGIVPGVKIIDKYTLSIKLKSPNPDFLYVLTEPSFSLIPIEEIMDDNYLEWKKYPIGAGNYAVIEGGYQNGVIQLKKYDLSLKNAPDKIYYYTKIKKEVQYDISLVDFENHSNIGYKTFFTKYPRSINTLFFTNNNPLGLSYNFRKFMQAALDRTAMQKLIPGSSVSTELLPKYNWGRKQLNDSYNPKEAQKLYLSLPKELRESEWQVPVFGGNQQDRKILSMEIKNQLSKYGFKISPFPSNKKFLSKKTAAKSPFEISGLIIIQMDPIITFSSLNKNAYNLYEKPLFDQKLEDLYELAFKAHSKEEKVTRIQTLSQYINEKAYLIPLLERKQIIYYNPKTIESLGNQDQAQLFIISRVEIKKIN